ncbi:MAG: hypothetical protein JNK93_12920 [Planctomycetia bacterium]|nr:hypothetical protein [Planctomycetia bacterium]
MWPDSPRCDVLATVRKSYAPTPTDKARAEAEKLVAKLIDLKAGRTGGIRAVLDWLRAEFGIDKPTQKLAALVDLSPETLIEEVRKIRGRRSTLSVAQVKRLRDEHGSSVVPLQVNLRESDRLERRVSDLVNEAFGLTPDEIALMWQTAPPRMPIAPPTER